MSHHTLARGSVVVGLVIALAGASALLPASDDSSPAPAAAAGANLTTVSTKDLTQNLVALRAHLAVQPQDAHSWALLAQGYVEQARLTADPSLYPEAAKAVQRSLDLESDDNAAAYSAEAALAAARHDFAPALESAQTALHINPLDPVALAIRTDALTELGRYRQAHRSAKAMDRQRPGLAATTRLAYQAELRGNLRSAAASFARAAAHSAGGDLAFALVHRANLERYAGRLKLAAELYRQALRARPDDASALAGLARIAVARHDLSRATHRARRVTMFLPLPEYVTLYGELLLTQGNREAARDQFALAEANEQREAEQGVNVYLELALLNADHGDPAAALEAARTAWRFRHTVFTADALGWALHVNGKDHAALPFAQQANELGARSAQFLHHQGVIEAHLGLERRARAHLTAALRADPGYSPWQRDNILQTLRSLV